jgi:tetrahydromethanopterin S-methyltransferase subunit G
MEDFAVASKLKEKFGEDVVGYLDQWVREIIQSETKDQYSQILTRLDILEDRYEVISDEVYKLRGEMNGFRAEVKQRFDAMNDTINQRFDVIDQRFDTMNNSINQRFDAMNNSINQRFDAMNDRILSSMKWSVGTIAAFGLIITILVTIFKFL